MDNLIYGLILIYCGHIGRLDVVMLTYVILFAVIPYIAAYHALNNMGNSVGIPRDIFEGNECYRLRIINILQERAKVRMMNKTEMNLCKTTNTGNNEQKTGS